MLKIISILYVCGVGDAGTIWTTLPKSLCDFGDMPPHTLVGGAQSDHPSRQGPTFGRIVETRVAPRIATPHNLPQSRTKAIIHR